MKKPTPEEIEAEVERLITMKPNVKRKSIFGDDHHDAIDAQIVVLKEGLSESALYDRFEPSEDDELDADEGRAENVLNDALDALRWRTGEEKEPPSKNWQSLIK